MAGWLTSGGFPRRERELTCSRSDAGARQPLEGEVVKEWQLTPR